MTAELSSAPDAAPREVVIRWVDAGLPHIWQIGYEVEGEFRPWAGGSSEEALRMLIEGERARTPYAGIRDRRRAAPGRSG